MKKLKSVTQSGDRHPLEDIKSDFITVASHQLRTPIAAIRWALDSLLGEKLGVLNSQQRDVVNEAYESNKFMVKVVNDLLRVSRLEEKGVQIHPKHFSLFRLTQEILGEFTDYARASNCGVEVRADGGQPTVYADPDHTKIILGVLIDNAIRYSKAKSAVRITIRPSRGFTILSVTDRGIGIPADQHDQVFSKFFRGKNAIKLQSNGLGLGLYAARRLLQAMGGDISFTSTEGKGSVFQVRFPTRVSQVPQVGATATVGTQTGIAEALKKEREFVNITVHELKAPLGVSKWSLEMLKSGNAGKLTTEQTELVDQVYRGNERLLVLVRDLLNLAKLQEGRFSIEPKKCQLALIVNDVVDGFRNEASGRGIVIVWRKPKGALPAVIADPNRIAQVVTNLLSNALKYTPTKGTVTVVIEKRTPAEMKGLNRRIATAQIINWQNAKGYFVVSVADTGVGIPEVEQQKLFTRFFRSKKAMQTKVEGTGLGLYITKSIVTLHQGDIWFTSRPNKGSTFSFSLPIA